nr:MAG TPA: hypothetical protein [Caudoviricetes sp.]
MTGIPKNGTKINKTKTPRRLFIYTSTPPNGEVLFLGKQIAGKCRPRD